MSGTPSTGTDRTFAVRYRKVEGTSLTADLEKWEDTKQELGILS